MPSTDQQLSSPSVDPAEIEKFNRLAEIWWDAEGAMWPLHRLNQLRIGYIVDQITSFYKLPVKTTTPLAGVRLLDIGCGGGLLSEAMAQSGAEVHGIDIPEKNIHIAKQHADGMENQPVYEQVTAESLAPATLLSNLVEYKLSQQSTEIRLQGYLRYSERSMC